MTLMYDSVNPNAIPASAEMVAGYIDGIFGPEHERFGQPGWSLADWSRWPNATMIRIAVNPATNAGDVLDVETGDATPAQSVGWVKMRRSGGHDPIVYMNASTWPVVRHSFQAAGVAEPHYWVADYDNDPTIPAGAIAKQYANATFTRANYDISNVGLFGLPESFSGGRLNANLLADLMYLAGLGRVPVGTEADWLVKIIQSNPTDFVGATLGAVVNSAEGKAWAAKMAEVRSLDLGATAKVAPHSHTVTGVTSTQP